MTLEEGGRGPWARSGRGTRGLRGDIQHFSFGIYHFKTLCMWGTPQKTPTVVSGFKISIASPRSASPAIGSRVTSSLKRQRSKHVSTQVLCVALRGARCNMTFHIRSRSVVYFKQTVSHTPMCVNRHAHGVRLYYPLDSLQTVSESIEKSLGVTARDALHPS